MDKSTKSFNILIFFLNKMVMLGEVSLMIGNALDSVLRLSKV